MFFGGKNAPFGPFELGDRWHVSVLPTLLVICRYIFSRTKTRESDKSLPRW
jgi:hypothetical protein